ncbi:hypothetical protein BgiMline_026772 [Biomphalaria glabrata]
MKLREAIEKDLTNPDVMVQIKSLRSFWEALDRSLDETILQQVQWFERTEPFGNERFDCLPLSIRHVWDVDGKDQVFDGKIVRYVKKGQKKCCRIVWDSEGQTDISTTQIITDVVMGDFHFV